MPQGTVIAIKPMSFVSQSMLMSTGLSGTATHSDSGIGEDEDYNIIIGVCRGDSSTCDSNNLKSVVWYKDESRNLKLGDIVEFRYGNNKLKQFKGAENVTLVRRRKDKGKLYLLTGALLSSVAVFASVLLLVAVTLDSKR